MTAAATASATASATAVAMTAAATAMTATAASPDGARSGRGSGAADIADALRASQPMSASYAERLEGLVNARRLARAMRAAGFRDMGRIDRLVERDCREFRRRTPEPSCSVVDAMLFESVARWGRR